MYDKCPQISYTKVSDKMAYANSVDPDQTAPEGAVYQDLHCSPFHLVVWEITKKKKEQNTGKRKVCNIVEKF